MAFGDLFIKAWKEYKANFKSIFNLMLVFRGIPSLIFLVFTLFWMSSDANVGNLFARNITDLEQMPWGYIFIGMLFGVLMMLLFIFVTGALTSLSLRKSKYKYNELAHEGASVFSKYLGFSLLFGIFIFLLALLLIIPGIIFGVYWLLGNYVLLDQKIPILKSLKKSRLLIKGKWWKTFGYFLLMILIWIGISLVFSFISLPFSIVQIMNYSTQTAPPMTFLVFSSISSTISGFLAELVAAPLFVLFFKNYYLSLKRNN